MLSASTAFNDEDLQDGPKRRFYSQASFWKAALPALISVLALTAALTLQLNPAYRFTTKVPTPPPPPRTTSVCLHATPAPT